MDNKHMKRCSLLVIREMQMKIIIRYQTIPTRIAIIKKTSVGKDVETEIQVL